MADLAGVFKSRKGEGERESMIGTMFRPVSEPPESEFPGSLLKAHCSFHPGSNELAVLCALYVVPCHPHNDTGR